MNTSDQTADREKDGKYTVVARRYRPRSFGELVGQENVAQALSTAIRTNRVGHAYLFTGARGVGKTSTARIFAKALNAFGENKEQALPSDIAEAIDAGQDMDVIEIDGASNRGIEEIRSLRANVNVRPSRSRYKIYIIDEVHMLTVQAFNALLKTLEEPPEHVKFIFCTTDPEKIPITVLSRCQRFDFSPVKTDAILDRLKFICDQEGATYDVDALRLVARRAAGSMRDSQSLLEQILSFSDGNITVDQVHAILGSADETLLLESLSALVHRDAPALMRHVENAVTAGIDPGHFGEQLLGYMRDMMIAGIGGTAELFRNANPNNHDSLKALATQWGQMTLLAAVQLLDDCLVKMRHSVQNRILLEVALIQMTQLQDLQRLHDLVLQLQGGSPTPTPAPTPRPAGVPSQQTPTPSPVQASEASSVAEKKKDELGSNPGSSSEAKADQKREERVAALLGNQGVGAHAGAEASKVVVAASAELPAAKLETPPAAAVPATASHAATPASVWDQVVETLDPFLAGYVGLALRAVELNAKEWQIVFPMGSDLAMEFCGRPEHKAQIQEALGRRLGRSLSVSLRMSDEPPVKKVTAPPKAGSNQQHIREMLQHPLIARIASELGGEIVRVDTGEGQPKPPMHDAKATLPPSKGPEVAISAS